MPTPKVRKISSLESERNKQRQQFLRQHGVNVKVDGSWGPWQLKLYDRLSKSTGKTKNSTLSKATAGAIAIPAGGYALGELLRGVGSLAISALSKALPLADLAPTLTAAAPIAFTLAGPAYGLYEQTHGIHHSLPITPELRLANVYASDAIRVALPLIPEAIPSQTPRSRSVSLPKANALTGTITMRSDTTATAGAEAAHDTVATAPRDTVATGGTASPQLPKGKKSFRERLGDRIAGRKLPTTGSLTPQTPEEGKGLFNNIKRTLWETKGNNFGQLNYGWRNFGRAIGYYNFGPQVVGYTVGKANLWFGNAPGGFARGYNFANPTDTMAVPLRLVSVLGGLLPVREDTITVTTLPTDTVVPTAYGSLSPVTSSQLAELDSINNAWWNQQ